MNYDNKYPGFTLTLDSNNNWVPADELRAQLLPVLAALAQRAK